MRGDKTYRRNGLDGDKAYCRIGPRGDKWAFLRISPGNKSPPRGNNFLDIPAISRKMPLSDPGSAIIESSPFKMNSKLPSERDFDPYGGDLDAQCAWKNFGGLTLEEATRRFSERPEIYHEDFMHMGGRAFNYYYPAIDRFLRDTLLIVGDEIDDRQSWVLPQCIRYQFEGKNLSYVRNRKREVLELCEFMLSNIELFAGDWDPPGEIESQWTQLKFHLLNLG